MRYFPVYTALALLSLLAESATAQIQAGSLYQPGELERPLHGKVFSKADCEESELDSGWTPLDTCFYVKGGARSYILAGDKSGDFCLQRTKALPCDCGAKPAAAKANGECVNLPQDDESVQFSWREGQCATCLQKVSAIATPSAP